MTKIKAKNAKLRSMGDGAMEGTRRIPDVAMVRLLLSLYSGTGTANEVRMNDTTGFAVFLFPQALDTLGAVIKPYLTDAPTVGAHIVCSNVDPAGPFFTLTVQGRDADGKPVEAELMIPHSFVRVVVSLHSEHDFGFGVRAKATTASAVQAADSPHS